MAPMMAAALPPPGVGERAGGEVVQEIFQRNFA